MREVGGSSPSATTTCCDTGGYRPVKRLIRIYVWEISTAHCAADFIAVLDISASNSSSTSKALLKSITECGSIMPLALVLAQIIEVVVEIFLLSMNRCLLCLFPSILLQGIGDRLWASEPWELEGDHRESAIQEFRSKLVRLSPSL